MNLYLVSQTTNENYDTYDSFVIAAPDESTARNAHPRTGEPLDWPKVQADSYPEWCRTPEDVTCQLIGVAADGVKPGVLCSSYNAG